MTKPYETETREKDGIEYTVEHYADTDFCDLSYLGEFSNRLTTKTKWYVDRKKGQLLGNALPEPEFEGNEDDKAAYDAWEEAWDKWHDSDGEILSEYVSTWNRPHSEYRYFIPENYQGVVASYEKDSHEKMVTYYKEHVEPKLDTFDIALPAEMTPEALGKATSTLYACRNYERAVSFGNDWWYVYIEVAIYHDGKEITCAGCTTESDSGGENIEEMIVDLMADAREELTKQADHYEHLAAWIRGLDAEKEDEDENRD